MIFADITSFSPPLEIAAWLACAAFALWFLLLVDKAVRRVRGKEAEPSNVLLEAEQKELKRRAKALEDWRSGLVAKLDADKREILEAGEKRELRLSAEIQAAGGRIDSLQATVAGLPNELMTLLANAKDILSN
jgi:hypothetical protein